MKDERAERALEHLVAEVKREPLPEQDWDAVEASLMARLGETPRLVRAKPRFTRRPLVLALAAAAMAGVAAAAVGVIQHPRSEPPAAVATAVAPPSAAARPKSRLNGNALAVGALVAATKDPVTVEHEGHSTWTLEPDSAAHVEQLGEFVAVALDRGALAAKVVPSPRPESFVVRVERTRVAVHGTAFRVVRLDHTVRVEVTEGVVGVGPVGGPSFDVAAPSTATVTLDGVRTDQRHALRDVPPRVESRRHEGAPDSIEEPPAAVEETTPAPAPVEESTPQVPARAPRASSPSQPIDSVIAAVQRCFREQTVPSGDVHISVSTQMSLRVQPTGRVGEAVFTPPLAPGVRHCVDGTVGALKFDTSVDGFAIDRVLELER